MNTNPQKGPSQKNLAVEHKAIDPKKAEKELIFILHCLVSSTDNGGKVIFKDLEGKFNIKAKGVGDKLRRIQHRYGLTQTQRDEKDKKDKAMKSQQRDNGSEKDDGWKEGKLKQENTGRESDDDGFGGADSEVEA